MKIKPEQLSGTLSSNNLPLYWLSGDEPLLMIEAADLIRSQYREKDIQKEKSSMSIRASIGASFCSRQATFRCSQRKKL
jgi:DNA polymerase III delta subunit